MRIAGIGIRFVTFPAMSRRGLSILALSLLAGCAAKKPAPQPVVVVYEDRPAAALAYAAPVRDYGLPLSEITDRGTRQPRAFIGYESLVREYFWIRTDDRFRFGNGAENRFERRSVSTRVGVIER